MAVELADLNGGIMGGRGMGGVPRPAVYLDVEGDCQKGTRPRGTLE